jgi:hypothetical protein
VPFEHEIDHSVAYLSSAKAMASLEANSYWPKWDSPWWHMLLLHEMGETHRIPEKTVRMHIDSLNAMPVKVFPIDPADMPPEANPYLDAPCHCQLGNVYSVLAASGVDVDTEVPWIRPWFVRYQMKDGGLNCDESAYRVTDECPSSMVGTIAAFESLLLHAKGPLSAEEQAFLDKGAGFLIGRKLMHGSDTIHNASERASALRWVDLCFPRFYLYDVLRGLSAIVLWSEKSGQGLPDDAIRFVVDRLEKASPGGAVHIARPCVETPTTICQTPGGQWDFGRHPASTFPLLRAVSKVGEASPYLSAQWAATKRRLKELAA